MDFVEGLPTSKGKSVVMVVVDKLTKYGHFLALFHHFSALDVPQVYMTQIYKLYGIPESIISDRDKVFVSNFWQELFKQLGTKLHMSTAYHPQNRWPNRGVESMPRGTTPYEALYSQEPPLHLPYLAGASLVAVVGRSLRNREVTRELLQFHLKRSEERMKQMADQMRSKREFTVGNLVYLKLQPYRQHTMRNLFPKYVGPFLVEAKIGIVAYKLLLPPGSRIHHTFHVSQLKKHISKASVTSNLPLVGFDGALSREPIRVIDRRMVKKGNSAAMEVLVEWENTFPKDATWENIQEI
ncbi:reverse transcriptase [Gossypium australe]|uniref:Reverse transcriptase n=1 Tax=Gossypium australe TaxID=47621 RepID=A0A5B6WJ09_9ROSI|nr:reverse transcriptase [Gossypium australe]